MQLTQIIPFVLLGWLARKRLYQGMDIRSSSFLIEESRDVSVRQIMS